MIKNKSDGKTFSFDAKGCMTFPNVTGEQIYEYRKKIGYTQRKFAAEFDIPLTTLRNWEKERTQPSPSRIELLRLKLCS